MMNEARFVNYKLGITDIDNEHWELFQMMDGLISDMTNKLDTISLNFKIDELIIKLTDHFSHEIVIMQYANYPYMDSHKQSHSNMLHKIEEIKNTAPFYFTYRIIDELSELFVRHVDHYDMQYAPFVKRKNN